MDHRRTLLDAEIYHADREADHADREEHAIAKWRNEMDHLQTRLEFAESWCGEKHKQSLQKIVPGSGAGTWLLTEHKYMEWRDCGRNGLFWLYGQPGSGKTVLTSIVIEDLRRNGRPGSVLAIFYCDYKFSEKSQSHYILRSLLAQLLHSFDNSFRQPQLEPVVQDILAEFRKTRSVADVRLDDIIIKLTRHCEDVTIVLDALDECGDRGGILEFLRLLPSSVRTFVTSRDETDIRLNFECYSDLRMRMILPHDIESDVRYYIVKTLKDHLHKHQNFIKDQSLIPTIIETLTERADGMFLWVFFQLKNILLCDTDGEIIDTLQKLPNGLEETFIRCLEQIDRYHSKHRLRRMLRLVVCYESINEVHLINLLNVDEMDDECIQQRTINDIRALVSRCGHLITTTEDQNNERSFTLIHASVYDFLTSDPQSFDGTVRVLPQYHFYPISDAYMAVAQTLGRASCIVGGQNLWQEHAQFIQKWHMDLLPQEVDNFLTTMFNTPLIVENML